MTDFTVRGQKVGNVIRYRSRFTEALVHLDLSLEVGERVQFVGPETDFRQRVEEMRIHHDSVTRGKPAQDVWIPVRAPVRPGDAVVVISRDDR